MNNQDKTIAEEIRSYLGLETNDKQDPDQRLSLGSQHMLNYIDNLYKLKANKLSHHDSVTTAFIKVHHNMYIDDPAFVTAFKKEMTARATPKQEIEEALNLVDTVLEKVTKEFGVQQEKDAGNNPNWEDVVEVSQPEQPENGELLKPRDGHKQKNNIESDLPIDRKETAKRSPAVMESIDIASEERLIKEHNVGSSNTYNVDVALEVEQEWIEAHIQIEYDTSPEEPQTRDYPGAPAEIIINDFTIESLEVYNQGDMDNEVAPTRTEEFYRQAINKELEDPQYTENIAAKLGEEWEESENRSPDVHANNIPNIHEDTIEERESNPIDLGNVTEVTDVKQDGGTTEFTADGWRWRTRPNQGGLYLDQIINNKWVMIGSYKDMEEVLGDILSGLKWTGKDKITENASSSNKLSDWDAEASKKEFEAGRGRDVWVPGCGGNEVPVSMNGTWYLYCYNHKQQKHAYLNMNSDIIISDEEAREIGLG